MKKIVRLTESDLVRLVKRVINEEYLDNDSRDDYFVNKGFQKVSETDRKFVGSTLDVPKESRIYTNKSGAGREVVIDVTNYNNRRQDTKDLYIYVCNEKQMYIGEDVYHHGIKVTNPPKDSNGNNLINYIQKYC